MDSWKELPVFETDSYLHRYTLNTYIQTTKEKKSNEIGGNSKILRLRVSTQHLKK